MSSTATGTSDSTPGRADDAVPVPERSTTAAAALTTPASSRPTAPSGRWRRDVSRGRSRSAGTAPTLTAHRAPRPARPGVDQRIHAPGVGRGPAGTPPPGTPFHDRRETIAMGLLDRLFGRRRHAEYQHAEYQDAGYQQAPTQYGGYRTPPS